LDLLLPEDAASLFLILNHKIINKLIYKLSSEDIGVMLNELHIDEIIDILDNTSDKNKQKILKSLNLELKNKVTKILAYKKNTIGYSVVVDFISLSSSVNIKKAKDLIKEQVNNDLKIAGNIFIVENKTKKFLGYVKPEQIFASEDNEKIINIINKIEPLFNDEHMFKARELMSKYDLLSYPVINKNNELIGVVEAGDIIENFEDATDSILEQAAVSSINKPYLNTSPLEIFKSRII
jgi:magnesium transporter